MKKYDCQTLLWILAMWTYITVWEWLRVWLRKPWQFFWVWLRVCKNVNTYHHEGVAEGVAEKNYESFSDGRCGWEHTKMWTHITMWEWLRAWLRKIMKVFSDWSVAESEILKIGYYDECSKGGIYQLNKQNKIWFL